MTKKVTISAYEFLKKFPDERAARLHIEERRWHGKPICPHCGSVERIQTRKIEGYFRCLSCKGLAHGHGFNSERSQRVENKGHP